ncbi:COG1361 family protein [Thalassoroseus pseudoceratinae]|uniref:DUF11 domain-containing protein n=1 Tax=Thalassoroseus pseudoceratinae TaxID=2713176 RepID=UPI0014209585|nr:DUF11 domain-containing protein [Thalassoroseus pseudoceratinae]
MDDYSDPADRKDSPVSRPQDRSASAADHPEPLIPEDAGFGWLMSVGVFRFLGYLLRTTGTILRWAFAVVAWVLSPLTAPFRSGRYAVLNSKKNAKATAKDMSKPSTAAVGHWLGRQQRVASIRLRQGVMWLGDRIHRDTAWLCASITGTAGLVLMAIMQLMYVLPTTASLSSQDSPTAVGPHEARDLLPLITSTGTSATPVPFPIDLPDFAPTGNFDKHRLDERPALEVSQTDRPSFDPSKPFVPTRPVARPPVNADVEPAANESSASTPPAIKTIPTESVPSPQPTGSNDPLDNLFPQDGLSSNVPPPASPQPSSSAFDPVVPTPIPTADPRDSQPIPVEIASDPEPWRDSVPLPADDPLDSLFGPVPQPKPSSEPLPAESVTPPSPQPARSEVPSAPADTDPLDALFGPNPMPPKTEPPQPTLSEPVRPEPTPARSDDPLDVLFAPSAKPPATTPVSNPATVPPRTPAALVEPEPAAADPLDSLFGPMVEPPKTETPSAPPEAKPDLELPDFSPSPREEDVKITPVPEAVDPLDALWEPTTKPTPTPTPEPRTPPQPNRAEPKPERRSDDPLDSLFNSKPVSPEPVPTTDMPDVPDFSNPPTPTVQPTESKPVGKDPLDGLFDSPPMSPEPMPTLDVPDFSNGPATQEPRPTPQTDAVDPLDSLFGPRMDDNDRGERPLQPEPDFNAAGQPNANENKPAMNESSVPYSVEPRPSIEPPIERLPVERKPTSPRVPGDPLDSLFPSVPSATPPPPRPVTEPKRAMVDPEDQFEVQVLALPPSDPATFNLSSRIRLPDRIPRPTTISRDRWERTTGATIQIAAPVRSYQERLSDETRRQLEADLSDGPASNNVPVVTAGNREDHLREHELDVSVEKRSPSQVAANLPTQYEIWVHNRGGKPIPSVDVDDNVPPTHRVIAVNPPALFDQNMLRWRLRDLKPNERRKLTVELVPTQTGTIETSAYVKATVTVSSSTNVESQPLPNLNPEPTQPIPSRTAAPETRPQPRTSPIKLRLDMGVPDRLRIGQPCGIVFTVTNNGTEQVEGVWLRTSLPETLTHRIGQRLEYIVGRLAAGESKEIHLAPQARTAGQLPIDAVILVDGEEADIARREPVVYDPGLRLRRKGWREITVGRAVTFTNHVENHTDRDLQRIRVEEFVPNGMEVVDVGQGGIYDEVTHRITWNLSLIPAHQTRTLDVTLRPQDTGPHRTEVSATVGEDSAMPIIARVEAKPVDELATNRVDR